MRGFTVKAVCVLPTSGAQTRPYWGDIADVSVPSGPPSSRASLWACTWPGHKTKNAKPFSYTYHTCTLINLFFSPKVQKLVPINPRPCKSTSLDLCMWKRFKNWYPLNLTPYKKIISLLDPCIYANSCKLIWKQYKSRRKIDLIPFAFRPPSSQTTETTSLQNFSSICFLFSTMIGTIGQMIIFAICLMITCENNEETITNNTSERYTCPKGT